jgi:hypothetical protein
VLFKQVAWTWLVNQVRKWLCRKKWQVRYLKSIYGIVYLTQEVHQRSYQKKCEKGKKFKPAKEVRKHDYIMIHICIPFWNKFIDFIYVIFYKKNWVPISWIFPECLDIRWQVAVEESLLSVKSKSG